MLFGAPPGDGGITLDMRLFVLTLSLLTLTATGHAEHAWRAGGGEIVLELNTGMLDPLGIEVAAVDALAVTPPPAPQGYLQIRLAGHDHDTLELQAPRLSIEGFSAGRLSYRGGLSLTIGEVNVDLTGFALVPHPDHPFDFHLVDGDGTPWFRLDHAHYELADDGAALELRHMNLTMLEAMAAATGVAGTAGQILGVAHARAPVVERPPAQAPAGQCANPDWAIHPEFHNDVTLIALTGASFMRCNACNGTDGGPVVFAPNAQLANEGSADVPWWHQFDDDNPPYDNDQHPYLIWNLYREDAAGQLEQIGASGVKHAFFTVNSNCPCPGGNILWTGCEDTYSAGNNDLPQYVAPRSEVIPATGQWGRCHSFFDPECAGHQTQNSGLDPHLNRLNVMEHDLQPDGSPGARYIMEAWYVVRDNLDIYRAMGWRELEATWNGSIWSVTLSGPFTQGPYIDTWADPDAPDANQMNTTVTTPHGQMKVAVQATALGDGRWRYDYAVANFDYMRATTRGVEPNLQLTTSRSVVGVRVPAGDEVEISAIEFARADRTSGQDWTMTRQAHAVRWQDPGDTPLDWGLLYRFSIIADRGPVASQLELQPDGRPAIVADTLAPSPPPWLFQDRFEQ